MIWSIKRKHAKYSIKYLQQFFTKITKDEFEVYMSTECLVIIVTHNSQKHIQWCLDGLATSESDLSIKIVDSDRMILHI